MRFTVTVPDVPQRIVHDALTLLGCEIAPNVVISNKTVKDIQELVKGRILKDAAPKKGIKHDAGKRRWGLLPFDALEEVVKVLEFGAEKYSPNNWKFMDDFIERHENSAMRHLVAYMRKETVDPESGLSHMAHLACNALFLLWKERHP